MVAMPALSRCLRAMLLQTQMSARRVVVDGSNNVQALDSTEEGKAISAIQVSVQRMWRGCRTQ